MGCHQVRVEKPGTKPGDISEVRFECSCCKANLGMTLQPFKFCPYCGEEFTGLPVGKAVLVL